jgi:hypothetical protein
MTIEHTEKAMPVTAIIQTPKSEIAADKVDPPTLTTEKYSDDLFAQLGITVTKLLRPLHKSGRVCLNRNWLDTRCKHCLA